MVLKTSTCEGLAVTHADKHVCVDGFLLKTLPQLIGNAVGVDLKRSALFHPHLNVARCGLRTAARQDDQIQQRRQKSDLNRPPVDRKETPASRV